MKPCQRFDRNSFVSGSKKLSGAMRSNISRALVPNPIVLATPATNAVSIRSSSTRTTFTGCTSAGSGM